MVYVEVFSLSKEGETQISKNFKVKEFACKDGSDIVLVDPLLLWVLQNVRDYFGKPLNISSAYRTPSHNQKPSVGGSADSRHMYGMAADFSVKGVDPSEVQEYLEKIMPNTGGIGKAKTYTHVDTREEKARWTY